MAKGQQQQAAGQVNLANQQVQTDTGNLYGNLLGQQNPMRENADKTLAASQSYAGPAADTYKNFAATGGFSPSDETTFLNRATRGVSGTYDVLRSQAERQRAAAGGLGTGGTDVALARHSAQDVASANTDAMAALKQQENTNKLAGAGGLSNLYGQTNALYNTQEGTISEQGRQILATLGLKYNTEEEGANILANLSKNPGNFDNVLRTITALKPGYSQSGGFSAGG